MLVRQDNRVVEHDDSSGSSTERACDNEGRELPRIESSSAGFEGMDAEANRGEKKDADNDAADDWKRTRGLFVRGAVESSSNADDDKELVSEFINDITFDSNTINGSENAAKEELVQELAV